MDDTSNSYQSDLQYDFTLNASVSVDGMRLSRMEKHTAKGALLNRIVEKEGADAIDTADAR